MCKNLIWLPFLLALTILHSSVGQTQQMSLQNLRKYFPNQSIILVMFKLNSLLSGFEADNQKSTNQISKRTIAKQVLAIDCFKLQIKKTFNNFDGIIATRKEAIKPLLWLL